MLTVSIELNGIVVAVTQSVFHARLKTAGKPQIHGQRNAAITALSANGRRTIPGAIVDNDAVHARSRGLQILNSGNDVLFFIVGRHDGQNLARHNV